MRLTRQLDDSERYVLSTTCFIIVVTSQVSFRIASDYIVQILSKRDGRDTVITSHRFQSIHPYRIFPSAALLL